MTSVNGIVFGLILAVLAGICGLVGGVFALAVRYIVGYSASGVVGRAIQDRSPDSSLGDLLASTPLVMDLYGYGTLGIALSLGGLILIEAGVLPSFYAVLSPPSRQALVPFTRYLATGIAVAWVIRFGVFILIDEWTDVSISFERILRWAVASFTSQLGYLAGLRAAQLAFMYPESHTELPSVVPGSFLTIGLNSFPIGVLTVVVGFFVVVTAAYRLLPVDAPLLPGLFLTAGVVCFLFPAILGNPLYTHLLRGEGVYPADPPPYSELFVLPTQIRFAALFAMIVGITSVSLRLLRDNI